MENKMIAYRFLETAPLELSSCKKITNEKLNYIADALYEWAERRRYPRPFNIQSYNKGKNAIVFVEVRGPLGDEEQWTELHRTLDSIDVAFSVPKSWTIVRDN